MKSKFAWLSIIVFGAILFRMPPVYAEDMQPEYGPEDEAYEQAVGDQSFDLESDDIFTLGDTDKDFVYTPVKPCRIIDTRNAGGKIASGDSRAFLVYGNGGQMAAQGGNSAGCPSPRGEPRAVHINIVAVNSVASGWLTVWPTGTGMPLAGVLNYYPGRTDPISNAFTVKIGAGMALDINVYAHKSTHVVSDVMGYYHEVDSVPLKTQTLYNNDSVPAFGAKSVQSPLCPPGYVATGGGCHFTQFINHEYNISGTRKFGAAQQWNCDFANNTAAAAKVEVHVICIQAP